MRGYPIRFRAAEERRAAIRRQAERHLEHGVPLLVLSGCSWQCSGGAQRPVALAREFARRGRAVFYSSGIDQATGEQDGVLVLRPEDADAAYDVLETTAGSVLVTLPTFYPVARRLAEHGWRVVYDLLDDWDGFVRAGDLQPAAIRDERALVRLAAAVTCSAPRLVERAARLGARAPMLVPNGGPDQPIVRQSPPPPDMLRGDVAVVYSGYLEGSWLDWRAFTALRQDPRIATTVVGRYIHVEQFPNQRFVGERPYHEAMQYVAWADVGIIPFQGELCRAVDAIKAYDYAAAGIWTVVTPVMEFHVGRPFTLVAEVHEFPDAVREAAERTERPSLEYIRANSWAARANAMEAVL